MRGSTSAAPTTNTAAELFAELTPAQKISPESFFQGMLVRHPEYGLGKVVAMSGGGLAARRRWHLRPVLARRNSSSARARYGRRKGREKFGRLAFSARCGASMLQPVLRGQDEHADSQKPQGQCTWFWYHSVGE